MRKFLLLFVISMLALLFTGCSSNRVDDENLTSNIKGRHVAHVKATIKKIESSGHGHQHLIIQNIRVINTENLNANTVENEAFVAIRYGDSLGLPAPVPDLKTGEEIEIQGEYIDRNHASKSSDNPGDPVLHFTHHPLGYVIYHGKKYE
jgi:hypothetical protein